MTATVRAFSTLEPEDLSLIWTFRDPEHPESKLDGSDLTGYWPFGNSDWDKHSPLCVGLTVSVASHFLGFGQLARDRLNVSSPATLVLELCSSLSERVTTFTLLDGSKNSETVEIDLGRSEVPAVAQFRARFVVEGRVRAESLSPVIKFFGDGTELNFQVHDDASRPDWDWDISFEDPYIDLFQEGVVVWIRRDLPTPLAPVESATGSPAFSSIQRMLWADLICHVLQLICSFDEKIIADLQRTIPRDGTVPGSFVHVARLWIRRLDVDDLEGLLNDPPRLRRIVIAMLER